MNPVRRYPLAYSFKHSALSKEREIEGSLEEVRREVQLNSTKNEKRETGSLYALMDLAKSPLDESQWFRVRISVQGSHITVQLNEQTVVDYIEPENV